MLDDEVVALYWQRDQTAIDKTEKNYGSYLMAIVGRILPSREDREEVVNDTYLRAWNSIPPHRPRQLSTYLGKIARQLSIDRLRKQGSLKRGGTEYALSLTELEECVSGGDVTAEQADLKQVGAVISEWLYTQPVEKRNIFVRRYYFLEPIGKLAKDFGMSEEKVKSLLFRCRKSLKKALDEEGCCV